MNKFKTGDVVHYKDNSTYKLHIIGCDNMYYEYDTYKDGKRTDNSFKYLIVGYMEKEYIYDQKYLDERIRRLLHEEK